jgi:hypothetical protein
MVAFRPYRKAFLMSDQYEVLTVYKIRYLESSSKISAQCLLS